MVLISRTGSLLRDTCGGESLATSAAVGLEPKSAIFKTSFLRGTGGRPPRASYLRPYWLSDG